MIVGKRAFPARNVRAFRILLVKDGHLDKKPSLRTAQVTVWDADAMEKDALREGKKYLVQFLPCHFCMGKRYSYG